MAHVPVEFQDNVIVFRPVIKQSDWDKVKKRPRATLYLRRTSDHNGVSINHSCEAVDAGSFLSGRIAVMSLTVGAVRTIQANPNLDVVADKPTHGNITGLPPRGTDYKVIELAEQLAGDLVDISVTAHIF